MDSSENKIGHYLECISCFIMNERSTAVLKLEKGEPTAKKDLEQLCQLLLTLAFQNTTFWDLF